MLKIKDTPQHSTHPEYLDQMLKIKDIPHTVPTSEG